MSTLTSYQQKALDYKHHISLTANAGSGKTFVLSRRYVEIAENEDLPLSNIVAITFTEKAASELYRKIADEIERRIQTYTDREKIRILKKKRRQLVSANISTIHSFCINILREFPTEAEVDANFAPIDSNSSRELIDLSIEELLNEAPENKELFGKIKYLIRYTGSQRNFIKQLYTLIANRRNVQKVMREIYSLSDSEITEFFDNQFRKIFNKIFFEAETPYSAVLNAVESVNNAVLDEKPDNPYAININYYLNELKSKTDVYEMISFLLRLGESLLTGSDTVRNRGYFTKELRKSYFEEIQIIENYFSELRNFNKYENVEKLNAELVRVGKEFEELFKVIINKYNEKKIEHGYLDFEDILLKTLDIIDNNEVRERLSHKYSYLMIDEYQDTNEVQYDIFMPILDHLKKGNLFVVGDEKQSIYMFRDAELEVFSRTKKEIESEVSQESILELPHSFRITPNLALFVNGLFKNLFASPNYYFNEVDSSELVCSNPNNDFSSIEFLISDEESEMEEAELLANKITHLVSEKAGIEIEYEDIAVLCRKRSAFEELEKALIQKGVPYSIVGGKGFYQRQLIYDIHNYLSFLLDSNNDSALAGVLRSPFFTISDSEIFNISVKSGSSFFEKLKNRVKENESLHKVEEILQYNLELAKKSNITYLLRKILHESGYWAVTASKINAHQELANLEKLLGVSNEFSLQSFRTLYDFVDYLSEAIVSLEDESQASIEGLENSIKIMTIHQAKGLEYKAVFLFRGQETTRENSVKSKSISVDKNLGILGNVPLDNNYFARYSNVPIVDLHNYITKKKILAETKRLLYVAVTRAINYLGITATRNKRFNDDSFIGLIQNALDIDFDTETFVINGGLKYLLPKEDGFESFFERLKINIPVIKALKIASAYEKAESSGTSKGKTQTEKLNLKPVTDKEKNEIISATKVALFDQCPVKYQLTYEFGYSKLLNILKLSDYEMEDDSYDKESKRNVADIKGRIIHSLLEREVTKENLEKEIENCFIEEAALLEESEETEMKETVKNDMSAFLNSETYNNLKKYDNYKNEYQIYAEQRDYYLYGVIDKLILEGNKAIIIDYKTDNISKNKLEEKTENYIPQLYFYAYIVSKLYSGVKEFELKLIFIKLPDSYQERKTGLKEIENFGKKIDDTVKKIRGKEFTKNLSHCSSCYYSFETGACIKKDNVG